MHHLSRPRMLGLTIVLAAGAPLLVAAGCTHHIIYGCGPTCVDAGGGGAEADAADAADAADDADVADAADAADADAAAVVPPCQCVSKAPMGWFGPFIVWRGPIDQAPACPPQAPVDALVGSYYDVASLDAGSLACSCSCGASQGNCEPPLHIDARTKPCAQAGGALSNFDPPPAWNGSCSSFNQLPQTTCPACVQSFAVDPLGVVDSCAPIGDAGVPPPPTFATDVVACEGTSNACADPAQLCAAAAVPPFRQCIFATVGMPCPPGWPEQTLIANAFDDQRACAPCHCGAVQGSACTASFAAFTDTACAMLPQAVVGVGSALPSCIDWVPNGAALGSKKLSNVQYTPGTCSPSGGEPTDGGVTPTGVATFCCLKGP